MRIGGFLTAVSVCAGVLSAQVEPVAGIRRVGVERWALVGAKVVTAPGELRERAAVLLAGDRIQAVVPADRVPAGLPRVELSGLWIHPGLIDPWYPVRKKAPAAEKAGPQAAPEQPAPGAGGRAAGRFWNPLVRPERRAELLWQPAAEEIEGLWRRGFCKLRLVPPSAVFGGRDALVSVGRPVRLLEAGRGMAAGFGRRGGRGGYPGSLMGAVALLRQTVLDARWQARALEAWARSGRAGRRPAFEPALALLLPWALGRKPLLFDARADLDLWRALAVGREFGLDLQFLASGFEYRRLEMLAGARLILPLAFPEDPPLGDPAALEDVDLRSLSAWLHARENPARLAAAGLHFALTAARLKKPADLWRNLRVAIRHGLDPRLALAGFTTEAAALLGRADHLGRIAPGYTADLVVTDGPLFGPKTRVIEVWVDGKRHRLVRLPAEDARGRWRLEAPPLGTLELELKGPPEKPEGAFAKGPALEGLSYEDGWLRFSFDAAKLGGKGRWTAALEVRGPRLQGRAGPAGAPGRPVQGRRVAPPPPLERPAPKRGPVPTEPVPRPEGAFGRTAPLEAPKLLFVRGGVLWTEGPQGRIDGGALLVRDGRIAAVGKDLEAPPGAVVVDARGRHVTPGIIDAHSHTAIRGGVNEATQAVTAEVRIVDALNPDDIALYRELAGGVTVANLLHGSANPIGGQSCVIKLRWGAKPDEFVFTAADPGIKFALGENVKQSNWGDRFTTRYPQTRMGVVEIMRDALARAREYGERRRAFAAGRLKIPPRRDLELDALLEVLEGKRKVHCHSYRQDEIIALLRTAESFGFRIGTLQHILEGYKAAPEIAAHGAHASTFSDWWAYKYEVIDAIPYNGALMHQAGIVVSFNSDSSELARRLNVEAAKAVKYGGLPPEEALAFVTRNPAIQLGVAERCGTLEPGKDADFVIWSDDPLSTRAVCLETWIDGRRRFSRAEDQKLRARARTERAALLAAVAAEQAALKAEGGAKKPAGEAKAKKPGGRR